MKWNSNTPWHCDQITCNTPVLVRSEWQLRESESGLAGQATLEDLISLMVTLIYTQEYPMGPLTTGQWGYVTVLSWSQPGYGIEIDSRNSRGSKRPVTSSSSLGKTMEWHWGWGETGFFFLRCYRICWQIGYEIREKDTVKDDCSRDVAKRLVKDDGGIGKLGYLAGRSEVLFWTCTLRCLLDIWVVLDSAVERKARVD